MLLSSALSRNPRKYGGEMTLDKIVSKACQ